MCTIQRFDLVEQPEWVKLPPEFERVGAGYELVLSDADGKKYKVVTEALRVSRCRKLDWYRGADNLYSVGLPEGGFEHIVSEREYEFMYVGTIAEAGGLPKQDTLFTITAFYDGVERRFTQGLAIVIYR